MPHLYFYYGKNTGLSGMTDYPGPFPLSHINPPAKPILFFTCAQIYFSSSPQSCVNHHLLLIRALPETPKSHPWFMLRMQ